jgi:hypothetical protein
LIAEMHQTACLGLQAFRKLLVLVTEDAAKLPRGKIEDPVALGVHHVTTFPIDNEAVHVGLDDKQTASMPAPQFQVGRHLRSSRHLHNRHLTGRVLRELEVFLRELGEDRPVGDGATASRRSGIDP